MVSLVSLARHNIPCLSSSGTTRSWRNDSVTELDEYLQRSNWILNAASPSKEELEVMKTWRKSGISLARAETAFLDYHHTELLSIGDRAHLNYTRIELMIQGIYEWLVRFKKV